MISVAADYADALLVARRVKRTMLLLLALILVGQIAIFATAQWSDILRAGATPSTQPGVLSAANWPDVLHYVSSVSLYGAIVFNIVLLATLAMTIHIMLVGRLIGVALVVRAFVLAVLLLILMFPWQTLLVTEGFGRADFVPPGVLYTWREIETRVVPHASLDANTAVLYWARFLAMPIVAMVILLLVQKRSGKGLKLALGEEEILPPTEEYTVATSR
jgi:hypothetical protein